MSDVPDLERGVVEESREEYEVDYTQFKNPLTRDILILQTQINLIEGLIARQSEIEKISENYKNMGLPFVHPRVPVSVCQKIPANMLCLNSHPDLKNNDQFYKMAVSRAQTIQNDMMIEAINKLNIDSQENTTANAMDDFVPATSSLQDKLEWEDIACLSDNCTAVLVGSDNDFRIRVETGDVVYDGVTVSQISPLEVVVAKNGKTESLNPVGVRRTSDDKDIANIQSILNQSLPPSGVEKTADALPSPKVSEGTASVPNASVSDSGPVMLSPTGLF